MRITETMLFGLLVVAAPLALARGTGAPTAPSSSNSVNTPAQSNAPVSGARKNEGDRTGSADHDTGLNRAEDQMSDQGRENTNSPVSPDRAKGKDRAEQRHQRHETSDKRDEK